MSVLAADSRPDRSDSQDSLAQATEEVLRDLIDALLNDGLLRIEGVGRGPVAPFEEPIDGEWWAEAVVPASPGGDARDRRLVFRVRPAVLGFPGAWRYSRGPVLLVDRTSTSDTPQPPDLVADDLTVAGGEQLDELSDRPVHPLDAAGVVRALGRPSREPLDLVAGDLAVEGGEPLDELSDRPVHPLDAAGVVRALGRSSWAALDLVVDDLAAAPGAVAAAIEAAPRVADGVAAGGLTFEGGEQLAALRDRPFHPLGRHKRGWGRDDAERWGPHAARPFGLAWWAVPRAALAAGEAGDVQPADVLKSADRERLDHAAARCGVDGADHVVLPVHPWQARHLGERRLGSVPLADDLGAFRATASLRTLAPAGRPDLHLKLPLAVAALGAGRQLAVRYLRNGDRAQRLLASVCRHAALAGRVHVCDESVWWSNLDADDLGEGELGCQVRRYPAAVAGDPGVTLVPLAALGVTVAGRAPALEAVANPLDRDAGAALLAELTGELVRLAVAGLAHGVMPEMHGQNVVVAVRPGASGLAGGAAVAGLVLRDHDAVRIHPPWLRDAGLPDPGYVVDGRTPNTLVADSPEALLAWFQMLGVHLGLFPVVEALAVAAGLAETDAWRTIATATARCLDQLAAAPDLAAAAAVAHRQLLDEPTWPVKLVMGPLLERAGTCGTSMPSAIGTTTNPLRSAHG